MTKIVKKMHDGQVVLDSKNLSYFFEDVDGKSKPFKSLQIASDEYYLKQAHDHLGSAIRDNSRADKIQIGISIDNGTFDQDQTIS